MPHAANYFTALHLVPKLSVNALTGKSELCYSVCHLAVNFRAYYLSKEGKAVNFFPRNFVIQSVQPLVLLGVAKDELDKRK